MKLEAIMLLLQDVYIGRRNLHKADPSLDARIRVLVLKLCDRVALVADTIPEVQGPANMDSYHLVSWPLRPDLPPNAYEIDTLCLPAPALYLTARICHFAPLVELSWLEVGHSNEIPFRSAELFDSAVLDADSKAEAVALAAFSAAEELGLELLEWEFLREPAPPEWPRKFWMPERPELRNYLFPGYFETWPEPESERS